MGEDDFSGGLASLFDPTLGQFTGGQGATVNDMLGKAGFGQFRSAELENDGASNWDRNWSTLSPEDTQYNADLMQQLGGDSAKFTGNAFWGDNKPMYQNQITNGNKVLSSQQEEIKAPSLVETLFPMVIKGFLGSAFAGAAGFGGMAGGSGAFSGGAAATNPALIESAAGTAGYGASSATPSFLGGLPSYAQSAASGAVQGGINSAINGQGLKGAVPGAIGGGLYAGVNQLNPAGKVGIDSPGLGKLFNSTLTSGLRAGLTGNNVGDAMKGTALTGGLNLAGNELGNYMNEGNSMDNGMSYGGDGRLSLGSYLEQPQTFAPASFNREVDIGADGEYNPWQQNLFGSSLDSGGQQSFGTGMDIPGNSMGGQGGNPLTGFFKSMLGGGGKGGAGLGDMAGSLLGLYQANRQRRDARSQIDNLSGMFSQNSPYAQQMRQQLARRDAAGGRRSQYGPREVEFQAAMAKANQGNAGALSQLYSGQNNAQAMMLRNLLQLGNQTGGFNSLARMFGGQNQQAASPFDRYQYGNMGSGD